MTTAPGDPYRDPELARTFEAHAADSAFNAHYDRPAVLELLGDVDGHDLLDAACGPGYHAEILSDAGARVTGFDASAAMVSLERETWSENFGDSEFPFWREPLGAFSDAATDVGFLISRIVEPRPAPSMAERWPEAHEELAEFPAFIAFRLVKPR